MRHSGLFAALILTVAVPAPSGTRYRYVYDEKADLYFGHVSYCDRYHVHSRTKNDPESSTGNMGFRVAR